jgi:hypothetical protein
MLIKEYRICMPLTVEEYRIGQLYMIAKHSHEQSQKGEGVEVVENRPHEDPEHGKGQYTEKRIHLSSKLPSWIRSMVPKIFYVTEKAWNYYPFTVTQYSCSFLPRFHVHILTKYENNNGSTHNCLNCSEESLKTRLVDHVDISLDECSAHHYKEEEDVRDFTSTKTGRGPLLEGWREDCKPIMCSYKLVEVKFDMMYLLQSKIEEFVHRSIREILLVGHRQAFAWIDDWFDMNLEDVRDYEKRMQEQTNEKVCHKDSVPSTPEPLEQEAGGSTPSFATPLSSPQEGGVTPTSPSGKKGWFNWS